MDDAVELDAPAKLNLFLEVLARRPDGYHEIDSVFAEIDLVDSVRLERASAVSLTVEGEAAPEDPSNLAWRAAEALGVGARIHLVKRIPAQSGLGGGSSDAAAVISGLDRLYDLGLSDARRLAIARSLGADVPFFLTGGTARCRGIGDLVEPLPDEGVRRRFLVLRPRLGISTLAVYRAVGSWLTGPRKNTNVFLRRYFGKQGRGETPYFNRLQAVAETLEPRLLGLRREAESMFGTAFTLSGTGSSYFAEMGDVEYPADRLTVAGETARLYKVKTR